MPNLRKMEITIDLNENLVIFGVWLLINHMVNVGETFTDILKNYFLQMNAVKFAKCKECKEVVKSYLHLTLRSWSNADTVLKITESARQLLMIIHSATWTLFTFLAMICHSLSKYLRGHELQFYLVHCHINNTWYNKVHTANRKPYLVIITD